MAIVCFIITLAWPTIRGLFQTSMMICLCLTFQRRLLCIVYGMLSELMRVGVDSMSCINARRRRSRALEEQVRRYNEWLEFNEWREGRDHVD